MRVMLVEAKPNELFAKVENQDIDLALISRISYNLNGARNDGHHLDFVSLWMEKLYLIANNQSELGQKTRIQASDVPNDLLLRFGIPFGYDVESRLPKPCQNNDTSFGLDLSATRFETLCRHVCNSNNCTIVNAIAAEQFTASYDEIINA